MRSLARRLTSCRSSKVRPGVGIAVVSAVARQRRGEFYAEGQLYLCHAEQYRRKKQTLLYSPLLIYRHLLINHVYTCSALASCARL